jgi:hypothetical protein
MVGDVLGMGCEGGGENFFKGLFGEVGGDFGGVDDLN